MSKLPLLALAALGWASAATAQSSREVLTDAARAFDEAGLRHRDDNKQPRFVRKWMTAIVLAFESPGQMPSLVEPVRAIVKEEAMLAGIAVTDAAQASAPGVNYTVLFDENGLNGQSGWCWASSNWNKNGEITKVVLRINPNRRRIDHCIYHEVMHALGFMSHPHAAVSILSYTQSGLTKLTPLDLQLIDTLYDRRLKVGTRPAEASQQACRLLGERLGSSAADIEAVCADRKGPTP